MINELLFMNGYAVYVLSAFSFTLLSFLGLYLVTKMQFVKEQNKFVAKFGSLTEIDKSKIRVGGMVKKNSISISSNAINFIITDFKNEINVTYSGAVPNLFAEGKGVVAEGFLKDRNFFSATKILAKHDENYMPPEVKEALGEK